MRGRGGRTGRARRDPPAPSGTGMRDLSRSWQLRSLSENPPRHLRELGDPVLDGAQRVPPDCPARARPDNQKVRAGALPQRGGLVRLRVNQLLVRLDPEGMGLLEERLRVRLNLLGLRGVLD